MKNLLFWFVCLFVSRQDWIKVLHVCSFAFNPLHQHWLYSTEGLLQPIWSQLMPVNTVIRISIPSDVRTASNRPPFLQAHRISITPCLCLFGHNGLALLVVLNKILIQVGA